MESDRLEEPLTEFLEEDGRRVERLVAKCGSCGQPVRGQRVLRFTKDELERWSALDRALVRLCRLSGLGGALSLLVSVGIMLWVIVESRFGLFYVAIAAGVLSGGGLLAYVMWRQHQAFKEDDERRMEILRRYGDMKPRQVGMVEDHRSHVILPAS